MVDVAGGGHIGIGLETTHGTYIAPQKFVPVENETLAEQRNDPKRSPMLGRAVTSGKVDGRAHVAGEIVMEALPEIMAYFLVASRFGNNVVKSGVGPYVYTANDDAAAHVKTNFRSLSIVGDRAGIGFAYLGCQAVGSRFFMEDGVPKVAYQIIGRSQSEDYTPGAVTDPLQVPFSADEVSVTIAAGARTDLDSVEVTFDDSGEAKMNISGIAGADYIKYGQHTGSASFEADFESKADYAIWKALTTQEFILTMSKAADQIVTVELHGGIYETYDVGLSGIGDQVRASATIDSHYVGAADLASAEIVITTDEDLTLS